MTRLNLIFFLIFFALLWLKSTMYIAVGLVVLLVLAGKKAPYLAKRALKSIVFFNLGVSVGYLIMAYFEGINPWGYIIYINLKVFTLTLFVFWFFSKVSIIEFFSFSKELSYLLTITLSQIFSYKKTFEDFLLSYKARFVKSFKERKLDFVKVVFYYFFKKSMYDSKERALAMRSRGFFDT